MRFVLALFACLLFPLAALAQGVAPPVPLGDDPFALLAQLEQAARGSNWILLAPLAIMLAVFILRRFGRALLPAVATNRGGAVLAVLGALAAALFAALALPGPHSVAQVLSVAVPLLMANKLLFDKLKVLGLDLSVDPVPAGAPAPSPVPPAAVALLLVCALGLGACKHLPTPGQAVNCGIESGRDNFRDIVVAADAILGGAPAADWQAKIETLALKFGIDAVTCAVQVIIGNLNAASSDPVYLSRYGAAPAVELDRAQAFLAAHSR